MTDKTINDMMKEFAEYMAEGLSPDYIESLIHNHDFREVE